MLTHDASQDRQSSSFVQSHLNQKINTELQVDTVIFYVLAEVNVFGIDELITHAVHELVLVVEVFQLYLVQVLRHIQSPHQIE